MKTKQGKRPTERALRTPLAGSPAFVSAFDFVFDELDRPDHQDKVLVHHAGVLHEDSPWNLAWGLTLESGTRHSRETGYPEGRDRKKEKHMYIVSYFSSGRTGGRTRKQAGVGCPSPSPLNMHFHYLSIFAGR